jgi:hypothetical protein
MPPLLTVSEDTRLYKFIRYIEPAIGEADYWPWKGGTVPAGPGAYAINKRVPDVSVVRTGDIFCAGVPNLALRCDGKRIPFRPNFPDPHFDGGIAAYFSGVYGPGYFTGYDVPFNLANAKRWARETRSGVLLGRGYWGVALGNQGHTAILLPSGYLLQSTPAGGLNWDSHIDWEWQTWAPNRGGVMLHPSDWLEYHEDEDVADWAKQAGSPSPGKCVGY